MADGYMKSNVPEADREVIDNILAREAIRPLCAPNCADYVVAHSRTDIRPVRQFSEVALLPPILQTMQKLGLNRLLRVQSYTWSHLIVDRGHGAMIVAAPRSGRTFSYIPPVCDVVRRTILDAKYSHFECNSSLELPGALAVILVPDLERVRQVGALCNALLRKATLQETFTLTLTVPSVMNPEFFHRLLNGVACLVATPAQLVWAMQDKLDLMHFSHLQIVVYDDVDLMQPDMLAKAELMLRKLVPKDRSHPQLVLVSQSYDPGLMDNLKLANSDPALIFGDILEAALYGKARVRIVLCPSQDKINKVLQMLEKCPPKEYRTVVFCSDDEDMRRLVGSLEDRYSCLPYYQNSNLEVGERVHRWLEETRGIILLATDDCPELIVRNAHTLIHYGMSSTWSRFKMRHLVISGNLANGLNRSSPLKEGLTLHSLVLVDDSNQKQLPRLVDFLKKHQKVDAAVLAVAKQIRQQMARTGSNQNVMCRQIMVMGDCINPSCDERHHADYKDRPSVPASGDVKVQLVRVYSPTHFCVHVLEHLPPGQSWQALPSLAVQQMRLQVLQQSSKGERYWPPVPGVVCLHRNSFGQHRVRLLKVAPIQNVNLANINIDVLAQGMDLDTRIFSTKSGLLYKCPEALQVEPPLAIDLRLFGMVPYSGERNWSEEDRLAIEYELEHLPKEHFLQANVQFATAHTLFVRNLMAITYATAMKMHVRLFNLCQHLTETQLAKSCQQAKDKILTFFEDEAEEKSEVEVQLKNVKVGELQEETQDETKENDPPNKAVLTGRLLRLAQMGIENGRTNRLRQHQELKQDQKQDQEQDQEQEAKKEDGMAQLYECLMNCALQQLEDEQLPESERGQPVPSATEFLDHMMSGGDASHSVTKPKKSKRRKATIAESKIPHAPLPRSEKMKAQLPPHVVRPPTSYYQTLTTLELQVMLPDEGYEYSALLEGNQILFMATWKSSDLIHQFALTLSLPYSSLRHHQRGRTVYLSVTKTLAMTDPLDFRAYHRFLKPNHDMFGQMDVRVQAKLAKFEQYGRQVKAKGVTHDDQWQEDEDSVDEDRNMDDIELGDHYDECYELPLFPETKLLDSSMET